MNILITGAFKYDEKFIDKIKKLGYTVYFQQYESAELIVQPSIIDVVICNGLFLHHKIECFCNLKRILLTSAGLDRVPIDYCERNNIDIYNATDVYSIPMAEFVIMSILMVYKQSLFFYENKLKRIWEKNRKLYELDGKNVGILGVGSVGREVARKMSAFGTYTIGFDIKENAQKYFNKIIHIRYVNEYLNKLDIVVCCLPITEDTKYLINYEFLSKMKLNSILVNVSRGGIVNENDLCKILNERKKMIAILDVFEKEPLLKDSHLWQKDNVYIYPHNSFVSDGNHKRLENYLLKHL